MGILEGFGHSLRIFLMRDFQNCVCVCVWKMAFVGQIFGRFGAPKRAQIGQYIAFHQFCEIVSTGFSRNLIYTFIGATVVGVLKNLWGILGPQIGQNSNWRWIYLDWETVRGLFRWFYVDCFTVSTAVQIENQDCFTVRLFHDMTMLCHTLFYMFV